MKIVKIIVAIVIVAALVVGGIFWMKSQKNDKAPAPEATMSATERTEYLFDIKIPNKSKIIEDYFTQTGGTIYAVKLELTADSFDNILGNYEESKFDSSFEKVDDVSWWNIPSNNVKKAYVSTLSEKKDKVHLILTDSESKDRVWAYLLYEDK